MAYLQTDDGKLYYEYHNRTSTRLPIILIHGFGMAARVWDHTLSVLVDQDYPVIAYDQRCCGSSDKDFADVSVSAMADDVVALCSELSLGAFALNGWSLGGAIAVEAASQMSDSIKGLVLTGGATPRFTQAEGYPYGGSADDVIATVAALRANRPAFLKGLYFEGVFAKPVDETIKEWCWQMAMQESPAGDAALGALAELDQRDLLAGIQCPSLIMHGSQDGVVPIEMGRYAAKHLPSGELHEMTECGHAPFLEDPEDYHEQLLGFMDSLG